MKTGCFFGLEIILAMFTDKLHHKVIDTIQELLIGRVVAYKIEVQPRTGLIIKSTCLKWGAGGRELTCYRFSVGGQEGC